MMTIRKHRSRDCGLHMYVMCLGDRKSGDTYRRPWAGRAKRGCDTTLTRNGGVSKQSFNVPEVKHTETATQNANTDSEHVNTRLNNLNQNLASVRLCGELRKKHVDNRTSGTRTRDQELHTTLSPTFRPTHTFHRFQKHS